MLLATRIVNKIRNSVGKNKIWVSIDETSDVEGRFLTNVVVGTLKHEQPGEFNVLLTVHHAMILGNCPT